MPPDKPTPAPVYLTAEHSICTAGGTLLTLHPDAHTAETVLELGALGYLYECHLLVDTASPGPEPIVYPSPAERIAALEAENARLRIRAEAREAQLAHAQDRLRRLRQPAMDVRAIFYRLKGSGAALDTRFWDGVGEAEARVTVAAGRAAEVDAAMLEIGLYPVGVPVPEGDGMAHGYSTDGTRPWETDAAGGEE